MRVLITDSDNRSALAATRSLGRRGIFVVTAGERPASLAAVSRYSSAFVQYPPPATDPEGFIAAILRAVSDHRIDVLLPIAETTTLLLTAQRDKLPSGCRLPFADAETIARASDKAGMVALAQSLGVPAPQTVVVESAAAAEARLDEFRFPVVIKPARSRVRTAQGWISTRVSYAQDAEQLLRGLRELLAEQYPVLLQERIPGPGVGFFACYDRGRPVAFFAHKRLREKPPSGGVSVLRESIALDPDALACGTKLLEALRWHGVAMVEFKRDTRDGSLRLMEINARFWGSLQLAIDAGVDFPWILARLASGESVEPVRDYRTGVRSRWLLGDLDVLLMVMRRSRKRLNLPEGYPSRWRVLLEFLKFRGRELHYEVLSRDDLRPWFLEARQWLFRR